MAKNKHRRQTELCVSTLKDLFLQTILEDKKYSTFLKSVNFAKQNAVKIDNETLLEYFVDDLIHRKYAEFINILEEIIIHDPIKQIKKIMMRTVYQLLVTKSEREEILLKILVNKLGDPEVEVANFAITLLKELQTAHMPMSSVITKNIEVFLQTPKLNSNGLYYSVVYLSQMELVNSKDFIESELKLLIDLFNKFQTDEDEKYFKHLTLIVKTINKICLYASDKVNYYFINILIIV